MLPVPAQAVTLPRRGRVERRAEWPDGPSGPTDPVKQQAQWTDGPSGATGRADLRGTQWTSAPVRSAHGRLRPEPELPAGALDAQLAIGRDLLERGRFCSSGAGSKVATAETSAARLHSSHRYTPSRRRVRPFDLQRAQM